MPNVRVLESAHEHVSFLSTAWLHACGDIRA